MKHSDEPSEIGRDAGVRAGATGGTVPVMAAAEICPVEVQISGKMKKNKTTDIFYAKNNRQINPENGAGFRMKSYYLVVLVVLLVLLPPSPAQDLRELTGNTYYNLTRPVLTIDEIAARCINETFAITGTTNLPAGTRLRVTVYRGSFNPGIAPQRNPWHDALKKEIHVESDPLRGNFWTYILNTTGSYPDEYLVTVEPYAGEDITATAFFRINETCDDDGGSVTAGDSPGVPLLFHRNGTLTGNNIPRPGADTMAVSGSGEKTVAGNGTNDTPSCDQQGTPLWKSAEAGGLCLRCPPALRNAFFILGIVNLLAFAFFYWLLKKYNSI